MGKVHVSWNGLTGAVGEFVGGMREDVVKPREDPMWVAVRTNRISQRMGCGGIEPMAAGDTAT